MLNEEMLLIIFERIGTRQSCKKKKKRFKKVKRKKNKKYHTFGLEHLFMKQWWRVYLGMGVCVYFPTRIFAIGWL